VVCTCDASTGRYGAWSLWDAVLQIPLASEPCQLNTLAHTLPLWLRRRCVDRTAILRPIADQILLTTSATRLLLVTLEFRCCAGLTGLRHTTILGIGRETPSFAVAWLNMTGRVSLHQVRPGEAFLANVTYIWLLAGIYGNLAGCIGSIVYMKRTDVIEHDGLGGRLGCIFFRRNRTGNSHRAAWRGSCGESCRGWGAGSHLSWRRYTNLFRKLYLRELIRDMNTVRQKEKFECAAVSRG
jgi:hypothetical protein